MTVGFGTVNITVQEDVGRVMIPVVLEDPVAIPVTVDIEYVPDTAGFNGKGSQSHCYPNSIAIDKMCTTHALYFNYTWTWCLIIQWVHLMLLCGVGSEWGVGAAEPVRQVRFWPDHFSVIK